MTVVVFGGSGFVGLNIVEALLARGERVTVFDATPMPREAREALDALPGTLHFVAGDVTRRDSVEEAFAGGATAMVYGAAITAAPQRDGAIAARILSVNLMGLTYALEAASAAGVRRSINLSSAGAYGDAGVRHAILTEETETDPVSLYALTKFASERVTARLATAHDMSAISVRLSAVFGRWERKTSVRDTPSPPFQIMEAALAGRPIRLPREDKRDYVYAPDVAGAVLALLDARSLGHRLYNISTGTQWSTLDWARALGEHMKVDCALAAPGESPNVDFYAEKDRGRLDITRLKTETMFSPRFDLAASAADYARFVKRSSTPRS